MIRSEVFKEIDDIDHLTIRLRRGEYFDRDTALKMIKRCRAYYEIAPQTLISAESSDRELHDELVYIRTVLFETIK